MLRLDWSRAALAIGTVLLLSRLVAGGAGVPGESVEEVIAVAKSADYLVSDRREWLAPPPAPQPQPRPDTYDTRLYRADLARAKRWGS
jgi:hypothetical protein